MTTFSISSSSKLTIPRKRVISVCGWAHVYLMLSLGDGSPAGLYFICNTLPFKIVSIVKCLPAHIRSSLYVDDFVICFKSSLMNSTERQLQTCLNKLQTWADTNGSRLSKSETVCVHSAISADITWTQTSNSTESQYQ
jgi:hypothetical protein